MQALWSALTPALALESLQPEIAKPLRTQSLVNTKHIENLKDWLFDSLGRQPPFPEAMQPARQLSHKFWVCRACSKDLSAKAGTRLAKEDCTLFFLPSIALGLKYTFDDTACEEN